MAKKSKQTSDVLEFVKDIPLLKARYEIFAGLAEETEYVVDTLQNNPKLVAELGQDFFGWICREISVAAEYRDLLARRIAMLEFRKEKNENLNIKKERIPQKNKSKEKK